MTRNSSSHVPRVVEQQDWEDLADVDLYWSILSEPGTRFGQPRIDEFFRSGRREVDTLVEKAGRLGVPQDRQFALDFGCGAGRLTRALASHFEEVVGVDISRRMIDDARRLNADLDNCRFELVHGPLLPALGSRHFDLVYTSIVLQHLRDEAQILSYLAEFARALTPGGLLAFQLASSIPLRHRLQPRRKAYRAFRRTGVSPAFLMKILRLHPIRMTAVSVDHVRQFVCSTDARIIDLDTERFSTGVESTTYYLTK